MGIVSVTPSFTNCRSFQGIGDFLTRAFIIIVAALIVALSNGCSYGYKGDHHLWLVGIPMSIDGADNKVELFKGATWK